MKTKKVGFTMCTNKFHLQNFLWILLETIHSNWHHGNCRTTNHPVKNKQKFKMKVDQFYNNLKSFEIQL